MPPMEIVRDQWDYNGPATEGKGFVLGEDSVSRMIFAADNWATIIDAAATDPSALGGAIHGRNVDIRMVNDGNITLVGTRYWRPDALGQYTVIFLSGTGPGRKYFKPIVKGYLLDLHNYVRQVVCIDYRGYGRSHAGDRRQGNMPARPYMPSSRGLYSDARAMVAYVAEHLGLNKNRIVLHGYSLGSGPATEVASTDNDLAGLILHGPLHSTRYRAGQGRWAPAAAVCGWGAKNVAGFDNFSKIRAIDIPICITCGVNDTDFYEQATALFHEAEARGKNPRWVDHGGNHLDTGAPFEIGWPGRARSGMRKFFQGLAG